MDLKELLQKLVGKAYNKPADEVSSLLFKKEADNTEVLKDDALDQLLELDKAKVKTFDDERKATYDKGYNKAKAETLSKREKEIRDKYSITEEKQGDELIEAVIAARAPKDGSTTEPTEDQVKRSKTFLDLLEKSRQEKSAAEKEWKDKYESREKQLAKDSTLKTISEKARTFIKSLNPILPQDEKKADNQLKEVVDNFLQGFEYEIKDDGKIVILKRDGDATKVLVDDHANPVSFESLLKERASQHWDFKEGDSKSGTGNNNNGQGNNNGDGKKGYTGPMPKDEADFMKILNETKEESGKIALSKAWVEQQKTNQT